MNGDNSVRQMKNKSGVKEEGKWRRKMRKRPTE